MVTRRDIQHIGIFAAAIILVPLVGAAGLFLFFRVLGLLLSDPAP